MTGRYSKEDGKKLLLLARESIVEQFTGIKPKIPNGKFQEKRGVFVTLHKNNKLRGCVGFPYPSLALSEAVYKAAKSAAFYDPRFISLGREELNQVQIEISILSVPEQCSVKDIKVGEDGVIIEKGSNSGLFLPQVWEQIPDKKQFLENLCLKAGVSSDVWEKDPSLKLFKFRVQAIKED